MMINVKEMEHYLNRRYDESYLYDREADDLIGAHIHQIILCNIQEMVWEDLAEAGIDCDDELVDKAGDVCVYIPNEIIDFYRPYFVKETEDADSEAE